VCRIAIGDDYPVATAPGGVVAPRRRSTIGIAGACAAARCSSRDALTNERGENATSRALMPSEIDILYEAGPCLVVAKPSGLLTQAPPGIDSLERRIKDFLREREGRSGDIYLGVPHRLDRPASGAMVFARHRRAARRLADQFEARSVAKVYWAVVAGTVSPTEGIWEDFVRKMPDEPRAEVVAPDHPEGRTARLAYRVIGETPRGSWLEIELETGRTHQIRLQAATRGHPLLGDEQYGSAIAFGEPFADVRLRAIALHARRLAFDHPVSRERVQIVAPAPAAWQAVGQPDM
jgi:23S rRNA pseudouridine1911/1915/1917 synthase